MSRILRVSPMPGPSRQSVLVPRRANSRPQKNTLISFALSMPLSTTTVGFGPSPGAFMNSAGSVVPSYGTSTNSMLEWRSLMPWCQIL